MKSSRNVGLALIISICSASLSAASSDVSNDSSQDIKIRSPAGITSAFFSCVDKAGSDNIAIAACISKEKKYQDARLNQTYKALLSLLDRKAKDGLMEAERAWLALKSKDENFEALIYGDEQIDNLQQGESEVFRICERANVLDGYLDLAKNK